MSISADPEAAAILYMPENRVMALCIVDAGCGEGMAALWW